MESKSNFPVGTLVYFGPDDKTITKIAAIIIPTPDKETIVQSWQGKNITTQPEAIAEIGDFFKKHNVRDVVMTEGVVGCPHVEGIDYPQGEQCPRCTFWAQEKS